MQIFSPAGYFIRRIQIRFIDIVAGLAIDRHNRIVAVDSVSNKKIHSETFRTAFLNGFL